MKRDENEIIATLYECSQVSISENPSCHNCKYKIVDDDDLMAQALKLATGPCPLLCGTHPFKPVLR